MVTVMDDFSGFILVWALQIDMTSDSLIEVIQGAVDITGMSDVPVEDRTRLFPDNGSGYVSRLFWEYLQLFGIRCILASPYHLQINGKLERYHQTLKRDVNQVPSDVPEYLKTVIGEFVNYYNLRRYHKALGEVTLADMLAGRQDEILGRKREMKARTIEERKQANKILRQQLSSA